MKQILITTIAAAVLLGCGNSEPDISIQDAAYEGNIEVIKQHLAAGKDANAKTDWGSTLLHEAALRGHKEVVELLITKDADVNAKDNDGRTSSNFAMLRKRRDIADLLRKHGGKTGEELKAEGK